MENKFEKAKTTIVTSLKIGYVFMVLVISWSYLAMPQDAGFARQQIAFLRLFALSFPASLFVDFWVLAPPLTANYFLGGFLANLTEGVVFKHCFVFFIGAVNAIAGYRQWFIICPRLIKKARLFIHSRISKKTTRKMG